mmetsp:Transcript_6805/g.15786  ORF Transcript_6805/g.15786 Transcript_6805/m.15786 type:complete len:402 (-) Transcript_6805:226-1431(-)
MLHVHMRFAAIVIVATARAAHAKTGFTKSNALYMYEDPPGMLRFFWIAGTVSAIVAGAISVYNIRLHIRAAKAQGFGQDELMKSYGARANRLIALLLMPLTFSLTAAVQMFLPGAAELLSLMRTCQMALSMNVIIELLFLLNGSQKQIVSNLPQEPIAVFGKPPLCCIFGWSCCAQKVELWHLRFFVFGLQQFMVLLPLVGAIDTFNQQYAESGVFASLDKACGVIVAVSTLFGMWSFKCLLPLMTETINSRSASRNSLSAMEHFLLFQMLFSKVVDKALPFIVKNDLQGDGWVMPNEVFVQVVGGFLICCVQLFLAVLGLDAYSADPAMYPPVNFATDLPPDTLAVLDMGGIDPDKWTRLQELKDDASERFEPPAPLLLGHLNPRESKEFPGAKPKSEHV